MIKPLLTVLFSAAIVAGGAAAWAFAPGAAIDESATFIVSGDDGYGIGTCMGADGSCGQAVADSWCVANGYAHAIAVRGADLKDVTGSIASSSEGSVTIQPGQIAVTCR